MPRYNHNIGTSWFNDILDIGWNGAGVVIGSSALAILESLIVIIQYTKTTD